MPRTRSQLMSRKRTLIANSGEGVSKSNRVISDLSDPYPYGHCTTTSIDCPKVVVQESDSLRCILETGVHTLASALLQTYDYGSPDQPVPLKANMLIIWFTALHMRASFLGETLLMQPLISPDTTAGDIAQQITFHQHASKFIINIGCSIMGRHQDTKDLTLMSINVDFSQSKLAVILWNGSSLQEKTIIEAHQDQTEYTLKGTCGKVGPLSRSALRYH